MLARHMITVNIDTWLGGDDDNSGYYFDYESDTSNKIVLKKGEINLNFKNGTGTSYGNLNLYND